jgi:uncharacterized membrane protein YphA (DoxX/SURF4 family)
MVKRIVYKEYLIIIFSLIVSSLFLLSAIGKYYGLYSFQKNLLSYGVPEFVSYIILIGEFTLGIFFMFLLFLKRVSIIAIIFVVLMTIIYTIGHYFLNIQSCECFGSIYFLNPKNFYLFLLKNIILIFVLLYIAKNVDICSKNRWVKKITVTILTLAMVFFSLKYNNYYVENYALKNIGLDISELSIPVDKINNFDHLFLFSPTCIHCRLAISKIDSLNNSSSHNVIGITTLAHKEELKKLQKELNPNFTIIMVDQKVFTGITLLVPLLLKVEEDKIVDIIEIHNLSNIDKSISE